VTALTEALVDIHQEGVIEVKSSISWSNHIVVVTVENFKKVFARREKIESL